MSKIRLHILSNTHWDREHRHGFQETRLMLVDTIDRLIEIMESNPAYRYFTMDGQALPLEDYLEVKPAMRERLATLVREGRLLIGPWYSLPDHFAIHPEGIVRNLLVGDRVCREFGEPMKFGYSIFSFGQVAQLPQIYAGFGIDTMIFYKMYPRDVIEKSEFIWRAPDGTKALCSRLGSEARFNLFFSFDVPVILGGDLHSTEWQARYTDGERLCHMIDTRFDHPHARQLEPDIRVRREKIEKAVMDVIETVRESHSERVFLGFDGVDFALPLAEITEAIDAINEIMGDRVEAVHSNPVEYFREFREDVDASQIKCYDGEMRYGPLSRCNCEAMGSAWPVKRSMHGAETQLIHYAEPFAAFASAAGARYPREALRLAWKYLLQTHAHDTVHGTGVAKIIPDTVCRLAQVREMADGLTVRAVEGIVGRLNTSAEADDAILITVFNPTAQTRSDVIRLRLELPRAENIVDYRLVDAEGNEAEIYELGKESVNLAAVNAENRPKSMYIERAELDMLAADVPAFGLRTWRLERKREPGGVPTFPFPDPRDPWQPIGHMPGTLDNGLLHVAINPNGTVDVTDRETGRVTRGLNLYQDSGCAGDMWTHRKPLRNKWISNLGTQAEIALTRNSALEATFLVTVVLDLPESLTQDRKARSTTTIPTSLATEITLRKGSRRLEFKLSFENRVCDHMLTAIFPMGIKTETLAAETAFQVIDRPVQFGTGERGIRDPNPRRYAFHGFADVSDGQAGVALFTRGMRELEPLAEEGTTLSLTLLRSMTQTFPIHGDVFVPFEKEESQCLGEQTFEYALYFHKGDWREGNVLAESRQYHAPMVAAQHGKGRRGDLPLNMSFLNLENPLVNVSAIKFAEDEDRLVVRLNNPTGDPIEENLRLFRPVRKATLCNLNEEPVRELDVDDNGSVPLTLAPYRIETVMFEF